MTPIIKGTIFVLIPVVPSVYWYVNNMMHSMPNFLHIESPQSGKFGEDYKYYMSDAADTKTDKWWDWAYENKYRKHEKDTDLSSEFSKDNVTGGDKLKGKCKEAYEKESKDLTDTNTSNNKYKYGRDAWRFCSIFDEKPKTLEDNNSVEGSADKTALAANGDYKGKIGETKKSELVSVNEKSMDNAKFWELREKEFFGRSKAEEGIGKHSQTEAGKKNLFNKYYDTKDKRTEKLKDKCGEAYKKTTSTSDGEVKDSDVVKYCGLKVHKSTTTQ